MDGIYETSPVSVDTACVWLVCLLNEMKSRVVSVHWRYFIGMFCMMSDVVLLGGQGVI